MLMQMLDGTGAKDGNSSLPFLLLRVLVLMALTLLVERLVVVVAVHLLVMMVVVLVELEE